MGLLPGPAADSANPWIAVRLPTNLGHARNVVIAHAADALVAVAGSHGTLSEIAIGLTLGKPVIGLGTWEIEGVVPAASPEVAVALALRRLRS